LWADQLDGKTKATGGFYRGDAARLVSEAARAIPQPVEPAPRAAEPPKRPNAPPIRLDEPNRPPLAPDPPTNQNLRAPRPARAPGLARVMPGPGRLTAWVVLAPWYIAVAFGALWIDVLFVKDALGL
jgi:hypothetical protein